MNPSTEPLYAGILAERLERLAHEEGDREFAVQGTSIRHSWAGACTAALGYRLDGVPRSNPPDRTSFYTFGIGQMLHEHFQSALQERYPSASIEVKVHMPDAESSGHIDAVVEGEGFLHSLEIKTINGTGYKEAIGANRQRIATGPRYSALAQGAVNAYAHDATHCIIIYLPLEVVSKSVAERAGLPPDQRHSAEWVFTREEYEPVALAEIARWKWVLQRHKAGDPIPRWIADPSLAAGRAVITDPMEGRYETPEGKSGKTWHCHYCDFQDHCASALGVEKSRLAGVVPISDAPSHRQLGA